MKGQPLDGVFLDFPLFGITEDGKYFYYMMPSLTPILIEAETNANLFLCEVNDFKTDLQVESLLKGEIESLKKCLYTLQMYYNPTFNSTFSNVSGIKDLKILHLWQFYAPMKAQYNKETASLRIDTLTNIRRKLELATIL